MKTSTKQQCCNFNAFGNDVGVCLLGKNNSRGSLVHW